MVRVRMCEHQRVECRDAEQIEIPRDRVVAVGGGRVHKHGVLALQNERAVRLADVHEENEQAVGVKRHGFVGEDAGRKRQEQEQCDQKEEDTTVLHKNNP